jgi:hypothetical protein
MLHRHAIAVRNAAGAKRVGQPAGKGEGIAVGEAAAGERLNEASGGVSDPGDAGEEVPVHATIRAIAVARAGLSTEVNLRTKASGR